MTRVVLFNAPPGSGKTVAAGFLAASFVDAEHVPLKGPLLVDVCREYNVDAAALDALCRDRQAKEEPCAALGGMSPRQAMTRVYEVAAGGGRDCFARKLCERIGHRALLVACDCGFVEELRPFVDQVGADSVLLVQIRRDGCTFTGDPRNWINDAPCRTISLDNNDKSLAEFLTLVAARVALVFPDLERLA